ncbi:spherulation-specific family 4 protein [Streptacidiphilus sp. EB103A]|uniref:spherulation-specific family 4 protein n=1 Tax=Streptacidiphilus sp. EB103A TaxID=3156275 RepID=UPI0035128217
MTTRGPGERCLLVPLYVHPGADPAAWEATAANGATVAWVVFNPASGPGGAPQSEFVEAAAVLRAAGVPLLGYVDTDYGRRGHHEVVADIERYQEWYRVEGVFLDQAATAPDLLAHYRRLAVAARSLEARQVVLNPGTHPDPGYAELADVVVTFEGGADSHRSLLVPGWTSDFPQQRFAHLVHGASLEDCAGIRETARRHRAGYCYATPGSGDNPWSVVMPELLLTGVRGTP